ncbi:MAG: NAD-binding protein [Haloarculaceae archaeon]
MQTSVVGCGRLGTALAAGLADLGHDVVAVDTDETVVEALNAGEPPVQAPGLDPLLRAHAGRHLRATTDHDAVADAAVTFLAHPTGGEDGVDATSLEAGARAVGEALADETEYHLVVVASPVLPGTTADRVVPAVETAGPRAGETVGVAVVPVLAGTGSTVEAVVEPERIVVGTDGDDRALDALAAVYESLVVDWETPVVETDRRTAEAARYVDGAVRVATRRLGTELATLCAAFGVDADRAAAAVDVDDRLGLGGASGIAADRHRGDLAALLAAGRREGVDAALLEAVAGER